MKRKLIGILISTVLCVVSVGVLSSCKEKYTARYNLEDCYKQSIDQDYTKKYTGENYTAYFALSIDDVKTIDSWIDRFSEISSLLREKEIDNSLTYFVGNGNVVKSWKDENSKAVIQLPSKMEKDEAFAWVLSEQFGNDELPYGVYAGIAAYWLNETDNKYDTVNFSQIESAGYLTELQFPIYETDNLPDKEKTFAWDFSYTLVKDWFESGKMPSELVQLTKAELDEYLQTNYNVALPNYSFSPDSSTSEYKVEQGIFTYYINKQFRDAILPENVFSMTYNHLSAWLKDNWAMKEDSDKTFGIYDMYDISVYVDDGKDSVISGYASSGARNYINIYSVGAFSHEYIHHILYYKGDSGYLSEVLPELQANNSKYSNLMWYHLFSGNSPYVYSEKANEKKTYEQAMELYNKRSPYEASAENFNFWLFADCFSAIHTKKGTAFISRLQPDSLTYFIAKEYGTEYIWKINVDNSEDLMIGDKTYLEVLEIEWLAYLETLK